MGILFVVETKNQWARDDPAFMVILSGLLCCKWPCRQLKKETKDGFRTWMLPAVFVQEQATHVPHDDSWTRFGDCMGSSVRTRHDGHPPHDVIHGLC